MCGPDQVTGGGPVVNVRDAVLVSVDGFFGFRGAVLTVPGAQHRRRQECRDQRRGEDPDLGVVIVGAALSEAQLRYEERNRKADPGQEGHPEHIDPLQGLVQGRSGGLGEEPGGAQDPDRFTQHQRHDDADGHGVRQRPRPDRPSRPRPRRRRRTQRPGRRCRRKSAGTGVRRSRTGQGPPPGPPLAWDRITGMANPSSTPATVAWIPEACTKAQVITPKGSRISHAAAGLVPKKRRYFWARNV